MNKIFLLNPTDISFVLCSTSGNSYITKFLQEEEGEEFEDDTTIYTQSQSKQNPMISIEICIYSVMQAYSIV